jgi:acetolactate synthase-1/2/3 large subunit
MVRMTGAKALIESLKREGAKVIFGLPGGAILPVYDVLYDEADLRHILVRHEQCAAHMADGYARASNSVGVCMATSGPGATNLTTGIATAYMDSSPVVAITGQVPTNMIGRDAFQEADIVGIMTPITKHCFQPRSAEDIPRIVKEAFYIASTGRPGPVLIDLPRDIQQMEADMEFPENVKLLGYNPKLDPHPLQIKRAAKLLIEAEKPFILAGGGVKLSGAYMELIALAELLQAPIGTTLMGKGAVPEDHPLCIGGVGMHGGVANKVICESDVILAVGVRFSDRTTGRFDSFCPEAKIIHIDIDSAEINKNIRVHIPIVADARRALKAIYDEIIGYASKPSVRRSEWIKRVNELVEAAKEYLEHEDGKLTAPAVIREIRNLMPRNSILVTEVGQNQMWAYLHFKVLMPGGYITSGGLGTMGFGFPAALGAKIARSDLPVVDLAGDGSFLMTEQDLATSVAEDIPVTVVVLNNGVLGMVAQWQRLFYRRRYSHVYLGRIPDFVKLAEAYGASGVRVESLNDFKEAFAKALKSDITTVIDILIDPEENALPMIPPGGSLKDMMWRR